MNEQKKERKRKIIVKTKAPQLVRSEKVSPDATISNVNEITIQLKSSSFWK